MHTKMALVIYLAILQIATLGCHQPMISVRHMIRHMRHKRRNREEREMSKHSQKQ